MEITQVNYGYITGQYNRSQVHNENNIGHRSLQNTYHRSIRDITQVTGSNGTRSQVNYENFAGQSIKTWVTGPLTKQHRSQIYNIETRC